MKKLSRKYKLYLEIRSRAQKRKSWRTHFFTGSKTRNSFYYQRLAIQRQKEEDQEKRQKEVPRIITLRPPNEFSILQNAAPVIEFIHKLKSYAKRSFKRRVVIVNLTDVEKIDIGSIALLLSVVKELSYYDIEVSGTSPVNPMCKKLFLESGVLAHINFLTGKVNTEIKSKNLILIKGKDKTRNKDVGETIKTAVGMLTGYKEHYPPIFSLIQEINGNSIEHAYASKLREHWILAINHNTDDNKVIFTFADNGQGILRTLRRKVSQQFFDQLKLYTEKDILRGAFTKKYSSRHEYQINRNKGLPLLKKIQSENSEVKNLFVITNQVFLYIDDYNSIPINRNFTGTFYYWELDLECIEKWKSRQKK